MTNKRNLPVLTDEEMAEKICESIENGERRMITIANGDIQILKSLYDYYYNPAKTWWQEPEAEKIWRELIEAIPELAELIEESEE